MANSAKFIGALLGACVALVVAGPASAAPDWGFGALTIRGDYGGQVISYALRVKRLERAGRHVRFAGRCSSACTLFLSVPRSQVCVTPAANFGFHLPYGASPTGNRIAANYLMHSYPGWVRSWVARNGGLSHQIKTMPYAYASKYLPSCGATTAQLSNLHVAR